MRDLMHVHSFSYDYHLRAVHQHLLGCHMTLRQGYQLTHFLEDFIAHHPDIPKFGRNHVFQGERRWERGMGFVFRVESPESSSLTALEKVLVPVLQDIITVMDS